MELWCYINYSFKEPQFFLFISSVLHRYTHLLIFPLLTCHSQQPRYESMTMGKVGLPRASTAITATTSTRGRAIAASAAAAVKSAPYFENDLNPYWNSSSGGNNNNNKNYNGLYSFTNASTTTVAEDLIEIPTEDANNVVSNETVVIYQYGGGGGGSSHGMHGGQETDWERERVRMEFYATYDVMTGLRIAGTLAAFFALMVMLVMYKSRRAVRDPKIAAVAAEMVQEEEDRELQEAFDTLEAAGIFPELETLPYRERRLLSLGNISAPPTLNYSPRFSSVGGGSCSLWDPPTRLPDNMNSVSSRPLPFFASPSGHSRREAFRSSRNSSSDRSQCVSFDMSEMTRRRSDTRAWMGRRATFQSIQSDSMKSRNKVFLSNTRHGRDANRIKLIRLYTTSSSREEDVEEVVEHGLLTEEEPPTATVAVKLSSGRQQSTSSSFIVSSVDYQDSDLRSVGSESMFSEQYADTEDEKERECSSDDDSDVNGREAARLKWGAYQKLQQNRTTVRIDDCTVATYEAPVGVRARPAPMHHQGASTRPSPRPKSLLESRTFELHSFVPKSQSSTGSFGRDSLTAIGGQNSRDLVHQLLRREEEEEQQQREQELGLPGTSTKWSKETLF